MRSVKTLGDEFDIRQFTVDLIGDLKNLRRGKISNDDARARAQLAREVLRSVECVLAGEKYLSESAKQIEG